MRFKVDEVLAAEALLFGPGTIIFNLYGPDNTTCTGTPTFTSTTPINGNGDYASANFTPSVPGKYTWIETYSGSNGNAGVTGGCQDTNESVEVKPAINITTQTTPAVQLGLPIHDTAVVAGGLAPTGTITFNLYGPDNTTCTGTPTFTTTTPITDNGTYPSAEFTPTGPGTYQWVETYSGDTHNGATTPVCNVSSESVLVSVAAASGTAPIAVPNAGAAGLVNSALGHGLLLIGLGFLSLLGAAWLFLRRRSDSEYASDS